MQPIRNILSAICCLAMLGCTATIATLSYPSSPIVPPNTYVELSFNYNYKSKEIPVSIISEYRFAKKFSTNNGWEITGGPSPWHIARQIDENIFLYLTMPLALADDVHNCSILEFNLTNERPEPTLISSLTYKKLAALEKTSRISNYHVRVIEKPAAPTTVMSLKEINATNQINKYEYSVLPIRVIEKSDWNQFKDLSAQLDNTNEPIILKSSHDNFLHNNCNHTLIFAAVANEAWIIDSLSFTDKNRIRVTKKYQHGANDNDAFCDYIYFKNIRNKNFRYIQIYDSDTKAIMSLRGPESIFY